VGNVLVSEDTWNNGGLGSEVHSAELFAVQVSELVHGNGEALVGLVVLVDEVQVSLEGSESGEKLIVVIRFLVLLHPEGERGLVFDLTEGECCTCKK